VQPQSAVLDLGVPCQPLVLLFDCLLPISCQMRERWLYRPGCSSSWQQTAGGLKHGGLHSQQH
jgi:hypothetical protein